LLTSHSHERATERAQEASEILKGQGENYEFILLLQGDEPQIFPEDIRNLSSAFQGNNFEIVNLVYLIDGDDLSNQNVVKAVVSLDSKIIFFSRSHVPHQSTQAMRQLGMIGFTNAALSQYTKLQPTPLEELESIDMMRLIENDYEIAAVMSSSPILGVDNPADINIAEKMMENDPFVSSYRNKYL